MSGFGCQKWSGVGPLLARGDHFWLPKVVWGDQFWLPNRPGGTTFGMTVPCMLCWLTLKFKLWYQKSISIYTIHCINSRVRTQNSEVDNQLRSGQPTCKALYYVRWGSKSDPFPDPFASIVLIMRSTALADKKCSDVTHAIIVGGTGNRNFARDL